MIHLVLSLVLAVSTGHAQSSGAPTAPPGQLAWSEAQGLIDKAVAAAGKPAEQQKLFEKALADARAQGGDQAREEALQSALEIAKAQAKKPTTDATQLRALYQSAFSLDPNTRREAVVSVGGTPVSPAAGPPGGQPGGQPGVQGPASGGNSAQPAAIPFGGSTSPPGALTAERLAALRRYRAEHLSLRSETDLRGGGTTVVSGVTVGGYRTGPFGGVGYGWTVPGMVISEPPETVRGWGVYQGPQRLTVPELLAATGETQRAKDLSARIHKAETAKSVWMGVAGVGAAGLVTGLFGLMLSDDDGQALTWSRVAMAGTGVTLTGVFGGAFPAAKAGRLTHEVPETLTLPETQALVDQQNEALRGELGLTPEEVWQMESGGAR